jgi:hypothetical protein
MREVQGSFDDFEKRLAIFLGLGAFLLTSLGCLVMGADLDTLLLRGVVAFTAFSLAGWWAAGSFYAAVRAKLPDARTSADPSVTVVTRDAPQLPKFEVRTPVILPAEEVAENLREFELPDFGTSAEEPKSPALG